mgnify:CR=1 FL=1
MTIPDFLGYTLVASLLAGFLWALVDLQVKIHRQPRRPLSVLRLTSYPFVPDDELLEQARQEAGDGLRLSPVPVKARKQAYR